MSETPTPDPPTLAPGALALARDARGQLVLRLPDGAPPIEGVRVARCFPWTHRAGYVSVRDAEGREISLVRDLRELGDETRSLVEDELRAQEFLPRITAVFAIDDQFDVTLWQVETDRGPIELQVKHAEDVRQLDDGRVLVRDHAGGLFVVADPAALDPRSRRLVEERLG